MSLRRSLLILLLVALGPATALVVYDAWNDHQVAQAHLHENAELVARSAAMTHREVLNGARELLVTLAEAAPVATGSPAQCTAFLRALLPGVPQYTNIVVASVDGDVVCSALPLRRGLNLAGKPGFQRTLAERELVVGEHAVGPVSGKPALPVRYPVLDERGGVRRVVTVAIDLNRLSGDLVDPGVAPGTTVALVAGDGRLLASYPHPRAWIGTSYAGTGPGTLVRARRTGELTVARDIDGVDRVYAFAPLDSGIVDGDLYVVVGFPAAPAYAPVDQALVRNLVGLGIVALVTLLLGLISQECLVIGPVRRLIDIAKRVGAGEFDLCLALPDRSGELGELATAIGAMAASLKRRDEELAGSARELSAANRRLRDILDSSPVAMHVARCDGTVVMWNAAAERMFGWREDEVLGRPAPYLTPGRSDLIAGLSGCVLQGAVVDAVPTRRHRRDGTPIDVAVSAALLHDSEGAITGVITAMVDITERNRAEQRAHELAERLSALSRHLIDVQEDERRRLGRELHDEIGQSLTAVRLNLATLAEDLGADAATTIAETERIVDATLEQVRGLSLDLRPPMLDDLGLPAALRWCVRRLFGHAAVDVAVTVEPLGGRLPAVVETACFRIAQEALTNVVRHARASRVAIDLRRADGQLGLDIVDDGVGFDTAAARVRGSAGGSLGILGMGERATLVHGSLVIESAPGRGTRVSAKFPLCGEPASHPVVLER